MRTGRVNRIEWQFYANEAGEFGISAPLRARLDALKELGLVVVERPDLRLR